MKKRLFSGLLALVLVLSLVPFGTLAEDVTVPDESVTEATEVTETTQVTEPAKAAEPTKATEPVATTEPTDVTEATDATQATAATETTDPTVPETTAPSEPTAVEKVQSLIDALPETVTAENREEVEAQLTAIDDAKLPMSDEQRDMLNFAKYNAAIAALNELDDMAGAEVPETLDALEYITVTGNGDGNWLHGVAWDTTSEVNRMAQVPSGVWVITYTGVSACDNYQFKFTANGSWGDNWGSEDGTAGSTTAVYDGGNICFAVTGDGSTVKLVLDLRTYDAESHSGAAYYIYVNGVQINGSVVGHEVTSEEELNACVEAGSSNIKLGADITLSGDLCITEKDWNLDLNGHTLSGGQIKFSTGKMTVTDSVGGGSVNNSITLTSATLSGTVFKGYVNCVVNSTINGGAFYDRVNLMSGSDVQNGMFYAQDSFGTATTTGKQVVFKLNGSFLHMQVTTGTVTEPDVAKTGYTLTGWCRDAECKGEKWEFTKTVSENMTLYGKSEITTYTITYDKGAEDATGTIEKGTKEYGKDFKLNVATYTRKGYIQVGWYDKENDKNYYGGDVYKENADLYLTAIWEKEVSYTIPFTKTVKQAGSTKPGEATFSLYICGVEDIPDMSGTIDCNAKVTTKGTGNFTGTLTISGSQELVWAMLSSGIYVQEWDSEMEKWSYDNSIYFLRLNEGQDGYQLAAYAATAKTVDKATVYSCDSSKTVKMTFTNTYGMASKADTSNPKTGDTIYIAAATCLMSAMALIAILPGKKRM